MKVGKCMRPQCPVCLSELDIFQIAIATQCTVHPLGGIPGTNPQEPKFSKISKTQFFDNVYLYLITKNLGDEFKNHLRPYNTVNRWVE